MKRDRPEFHAQGSTVPNMHCRPESQPDRYEWRCILSFYSPAERKEKQKIGLNET